MAEESRSGGLWVGALAVIAIGIAGYFIYMNNKSAEPNIPPINMSREEIMSKAMVDGPGNDPNAKTDPNVPKTVDIKKKKSTP